MAHAGRELGLSRLSGTVGKGCVCVCVCVNKFKNKWMCVEYVFDMSIIKVDQIYVCINVHDIHIF